MKSKGDVAGLVSERACEFLPSVFGMSKVFRMDLGVCK